MKTQHDPVAVKKSELHYVTGESWEGEVSNESESEELPVKYTSLDLRETGRYVNRMSFYGLSLYIFAVFHVMDFSILEKRLSVSMPTVRRWR